MVKGWIKLHRQFTKWGWYKDVNTKVVFLHLLLTANYTETEYQGIKLKPGQVPVGRKSLAKELGLTERQVRTAIEHLKSTNEITTWSTSKFTVVTIEKWRDYQSDMMVSDQVSDQVEVKRATSERPANDHTIRNKEIKNNKNHSSSREEDEDLISFEEAQWRMNPRNFELNEWGRKSVEERREILKHRSALALAEVEREFKNFKREK